MLFKIKALELAENPSIYWKEEKKRKHPGIAYALEVFVSYLLVFLLCSGSVMVYDSVFPIDTSMHILLLCIGIVEMILFFVYLFPALRRLAPLLTACSFFVGFLILRHPVISGLKQCANEVIRRFNAHFGSEIFTFHEVEETALKQTAIYFLALLFLWWFVESLFHLKKIFLLALPPLFLICGELLSGKAPGELSLVMTAGGFFTLLSFDGRQIRMGSRMAGLKGKASFFLAAAVFISFFLTDRYSRETAEKLITLQDEMLSYQFALERQIIEYTPGSFFVQSPGQVSNKTPRYEGKEMLSIITDRCPAENLYLRGYVGDTYRNGNWTNRSQAEFDDAAAGRLSYADRAEAGKEVLNFFYRSQLLPLVSYRSSFQINYSDVEDDYAYLPYMTDLEHISKDGRTVMPLLFTADAMVCRENADSLYGELILPYYFLKEGVKDLEHIENKEIESWYQEYLSQYLRTPVGLSKLRELGRELLLELNRNYRSVTAPQSLAETREIYAACLVREVLFERASYSLELDRLPFGKDVVEYFLFESGEGFCEHYASAGALLLRQMGIPARYVSGYVVRPDEFVRSGDTGEGANVTYSAVVKDDAAHAWVEVFIEHVGWVPVEMTEGSVYETAGNYNYSAEFYEDLWDMNDSKENSYGSSQINNGSKEDRNERIEEEESGQTQTENLESGQNTPDETKEAEPESQDKDGDGSGEYGSKENSQGSKENSQGSKENSQGSKENSQEHSENDQTLDGKATLSEKQAKEGYFSFLLPGIVLFTGAVFIFWYRKQRRKQKADWMQKSYRKAIEEITERINRLLRRKGILKMRGLDDRGYKETLLKELDRIPKEELYEYFSVLERTAYSNEALKKADVLCCYTLYTKIKEG